jgi:uncharacterized protein (UPF0332 family)
VSPADPTALEALWLKAETKLAGAQSAYSQGFFDDAVSRAYYAAFHAVTATLASSGLSFSSHGQTIGAFNREFVLSGQLPPDTFRRLQRRYEDRHVGDYGVARSIDEPTARRDVEDAVWLLSACRALVEEHCK